MNLSDMSDLQLDALREIVNIGSGQAATYLSELVGRTIRLEVPTIAAIDIVDVAHVFGGPEQVVGAVYAQLGGDVHGGMLFMASPDALRGLVGMLGQVPGPTSEITDDQLADVLLGVAERLATSCLVGISAMTGLEVHTSGVAWACDMAGALLQAVVAEISMRADSAILVSTAFIDRDRTVEAAFFFVPDPESLDVILSSLGLA